MNPLCEEVFISCNANQRAAVGLPLIEDRFLGIGPMGGLLSAFQSAPDRAWLTVACDMPYLGYLTLEYLIANRNTSKLATAFKNTDQGFPEPLVTIWEPRAYQVLLQALSAGISCPRKVLMASAVALLDAPDQREMQNINDDTAYRLAVSQLADQQSKTRM
jgi:molybdopterin-guanine dinucleotide biosynthesis protein A